MKSEDPQYRFPGLNSFREDDKDIFKGRQKESANLYAKISLYKTVVLHADSGTGKSSLIQAGLLPLLKKSEENYFPVILQFNEIVQGDTVSLLTDFTLKKIEDNIGDGKINTPSIDILDGQKKSLWKYSKILEKAGKKLLLIFDQFENLQTFKPKQVEQFVEELYNFINPKIPSNVFKSIEAQFSSIVDEKNEKFNQVNQSYLFLNKPSVANLLFVIREDKLGVMSLLSDYFPDILKNDFRIEPLSITYAKEALEIPAAYKESQFKSAPFSFEDPDYVINKIADEDTGLVDPVLLQIVASSVEINQVIHDKKVSISNDDIPEVSNIVTEYYSDSLEKIREKLDLTELQVSEYKKNTLSKFVINERRTLVDSESIQANHIKFIKALVKTGLIREIPAEKKAIYYQLVHDRMIVPIINDPKIIKANYFERYLKSIKFVNRIAIISIVLLLLSLFYIEGNYFNFSADQNNLNIRRDSINNNLSIVLKQLNNLRDTINDAYNSILVFNSQMEMNKNLRYNSTEFNSLKESKEDCNNQVNKLSSNWEKKKIEYLNTFKEQRSLPFDKISLSKYLTPLKKIEITVLNILLWVFLLFFQFARRISLKYLFQEIQIYKRKQINKNDNFKLFLPLWLAPFSKTNDILLSSLKPINIFNKSFSTSFLNFILVLCLLIIITVQFRLTYISYVFRDNNLDLKFCLNVLFTLFSIAVATFWFTPLNNKEYSNDEENSKILSRKDFINLSIYSILAFALFRLGPILSENKKPRFTGIKPRFTGIKNPRYRKKKLKPKFSLPDYKSQIVENKESKVIHFIDDKGFSLALKSIPTYKDFILFKRNIERFNQFDKLAIKGKPRISIKGLSWNAENIALDCLKSGNIKIAVKILQYGIRQNYKSSLRLSDLLVLICIKHNTKVPKDALDQLITYSAISKDKRLIERVEKWKNQNWITKKLNRPKIVFNKIEI